MEDKVRRTTTTKEVTKSSNIQGSLSRRRLLKVAPATGIASALAGCASPLAGSEEIFIGSTIPQSGPYGVVGEKIQEGIELAVKHSNEQNVVGDTEIRVEFADTKTDPSTGRQRAREFINDGADVIGGAISDATAKAIATLCQIEQRVNVSIGGSAKATGPKCKPSHFIVSGSTYQHSHGAPRYVLEEDLGNSVFTVTADYLWGQSNRAIQENVLAPQYDAEYLGNTYTQLGTEDFSQPLIEARDSGAEIIILNLFGGEHIKTAIQAEEFGLYEKATVVWPFTGLIEGQAIPAEIRNNDSFYAGVWFWPTLGQGDDAIPDAKSFVDAYKKEYDAPPTSVAAMNYTAFRTVLEVMGKQGITDGSGEGAQNLRKGLEGKELSQQLWGVGEKFRACDHSMIFPQMTVQGSGKSDPSPVEMYEIIDFPKDPFKTQNMKCKETGCNMPDKWSG